MKYKYLLLIFLFFSPFLVEAQYSQTIDNDNLSWGSSGIQRKVITFYNISGDILDFTWTMATPNSWGMILEWYECDSLFGVGSSWATELSNASCSQVSARGLTRGPTSGSGSVKETMTYDYTLLPSTEFTFDPTKFYVLGMIENMSSGSANLGGFDNGNSAYSYDTIDCTGTSNCSTSNGGFWYNYFILNTSDNPQQIVSNSYIISVDEPDRGEITASTTVTFEYTYYGGESSSSTVSEVAYTCYEYQWIIGSLFNSFSGCETANTSVGNSVFSTTTTLIGTTTYSWRGWLLDFNGNPLAYSTWQDFSVLALQNNAYNDIFSIGQSSTTTVQELNLQCDPQESLWERSVCNLGILLFVPSGEALLEYQSALSTLQGKTPFYEFEQIKNTIQGLQTPESAEDITLSIVLPDQFGGEEIELLSEAVMIDILGETLFNLYYTLFGLSLYLWFSIYVWKRAVNIFRFT